MGKLDSLVHRRIKLWLLDGPIIGATAHGHPDAMVPCREIPLESVLGGQADGYRPFAQACGRYWRTFFDPIAVRVQMQPGQVRMELTFLEDGLHAVVTVETTK